MRSPAPVVLHPSFFSAVFSARCAMMRQAEGPAPHELVRFARRAGAEAAIKTCHHYC